MSDLSARLKELRESKGLSKIEMAKKIGVSGGAYSNWEYGNREPNIDTLKKIASVFDISSSELLKFGSQEKFTLHDVTVKREDETHYSYKAHVTSDSFVANIFGKLELLTIIPHLGSNPALALNIKIKDIKTNKQEFNLHDLEPIFLELVARSAIEYIPYSLTNKQEYIPVFTMHGNSTYDGIFYLK